MNKKRTLIILLIILTLIISNILVFVITKQVIVRKTGNAKDVFVVTNSEVEWQSEGGSINGLYNGENLFCIEANFYRSMFQTNEKFYIFNNIIYYEEITYIYEIPMDTSRISFMQESFIIIEDEIYRREFDEQANVDKFVLYEEENKIIENFKKYTKIIEDSYSNKIEK